MSVYLGNMEIGQMYLGSTEIAEAYLGSIKVWDKGGVTPPQPVLPYDAQVEYLESSSSPTQYIETGIIPTSNTGIQITFYRFDTVDTYICGLRNDGNNTRWCIGNQLYYGYGVYAERTNAPSLTKLTCELNYLNSGKYVVDDYKEVNLPTLSFTPAYNIRLFGSAGVSAGYTKWYGRIYGAKISEGTDIIMDLTPVRVGQVGYMYDKISGNLFGNSGTGSFTLGNDITT